MFFEAFEGTTEILKFKMIQYYEWNGNQYTTISHQKCSHRVHLYFFVSSEHSKHFIVGLLLIVVWKAKQKQCANICQMGNVTLLLNVFFI